MDNYEGKLISDMDFQKYLNLPKYLHCSELKMIQQSMNHWLSEKGFPETKALILGSLGHTMILEMDKLTERYLVMPKVDARTKGGKEQKMLAQEQAKLEEKILISQEDFTQALGWRENILKNPVTSNVFQKAKGENEVSGFFRHPDFDNILGAFRVDKLLEEQKIAIDLKIMLSANPYAFSSSVKKFGYHMQAAWYLDGLKAITGDDYDFIFVVCEKSNPHNVQSYRLSEKDLERGRDDIRATVKKYQQYQGANEDQRNRLSGYYDGIQTLEVFN
jgi:hypothetical protein